MGTTAEKFNYAFGTKDLLKTEINKINNVLDDNSTFRSYPQELFNGYLDILNNGTDTLWNNLEKVSASGEEATLENVETAPLKMVLNGNTSQETTTGKNLFDETQISRFGRYNAREVINDDKSITITSTGSNGYVVIAPVQQYENGKTYTISFKVDDISKFSRVRMFINTSTPKYSTSFTNIITFTANEDEQLYFGIYPVENETITISNIQIELGSTATSYEPYTGGQPSPSPDYPQQVKVVKGENVVSVSGKQLFNIDDILIGTKINDRTFTATHVNGKLIEMDFNPNLKYNIGFKIRQDHESNGVFVRIMYTDGTNVSMNSTSTDTVSKTILTTKAIREILLQYSAYNTITTFEDFYIYEETTDTSYVPYSKTDYPINLGDIELCKINTYKDYFHKDSGKWYVHKEIGKDKLSSLNVVYHGVSNNIYQYELLPTNIPIQSEAILSTHFSHKTSTSVGWWNFDNNIVINIVSGNIHIYMTTSQYANITEFNNFTSSNDVYIYYPLATPTEEEITNSTLIEQLEAISKAKSVKDKTYITQTNEELPFILDVEAIKEYEVN